jgi:hypothetical protein
VTRLEVIRPFVEQTMKSYLGVDELKTFPDGTIPIRAGSTAVNVRLVEGTTEGLPLLQIFSPMLSGVPATAELLTRLNEMNASLSFARAFWVNDQVILAMELLAEELDEEQVAHACSLVTFAADHWDDVLQEDFGGERYFNDAPAAEGATVPGAASAEGDAMPPPGEDGPPSPGYI